MPSCKASRSSIDTDAGCCASANIVTLSMTVGASHLASATLRPAPVTQMLVASPVSSTCTKSVGAPWRTRTSPRSPVRIRARLHNSSRVLLGMATRRGTRSKIERASVVSVDTALGTSAFVLSGNDRTGTHFHVDPRATLGPAQASQDPRTAPHRWHVARRWSMGRPLRRLLIFDADREAVDRIIADDPYYRIEGVTVASVRDWTPIVGPR